MSSLWNKLESNPRTRIPSTNPLTGSKFLFHPDNQVISSQGKRPPRMPKAYKSNVVIEDVSDDGTLYTPERPRITHNTAKSIESEHKKRKRSDESVCTRNGNCLKHRFRDCPDDEDEPEEEEEKKVLPHHWINTRLKKNDLPAELYVEYGNINDNKTITWDGDIQKRKVTWTNSDQVSFDGDEFDGWDQTQHVYTPYTDMEKGSYVVRVADPDHILDRYGKGGARKHSSSITHDTVKAKRVKLTGPNDRFIGGRSYRGDSNVKSVSGLFTCDEKEDLGDGVWDCSGCTFINDLPGVAKKGDEADRVTVNWNKGWMKVDMSDTKVLDGKRSKIQIGLHCF